ncbi:MAG: insulinase family protein [Ignavibacteriales bacterium]|nr:insulinase family protein [Ignavibacteriales bacterium]MCF8314891.1 insulinase family protein [Ignavibacteriales bacterium]MCF8436160.1 insulinase family protein [Ignavibacteriales bacterium]
MIRKTIMMILLFASVTVFAEEKKIEFEQYKLDNGLNVILHQDNSTPIVAVTIMYHVGSKNEDPKRTGFAHFFEHLMFEGSKNIDRGGYDKIVQKAGGTLNANTSFDRTFYYQILPANQLELGLWLESERLLHLKIDSIGVETQRKVVKEEKKQRLDNQPYGSLLEKTFANAYKVHPYRWTPIGSAQYIDDATLDEFLEFYKTYYVPNNATLSIAGDIDIDDAKDLIEKYFSDIPSGQRKMLRPEIVEPPMEKEVKEIVYDNVQLPLIVNAYHIPAQGTDDYYALSMLTTLLSGGKSSRLYKELVDNKQVALQAGSIPFALEDPGLFITFAIPNIGIEPDSLQNEIGSEIAAVKKDLITEREFEKLQNQIEADFVTQNSTVEGIAESLANYFVYFGNADLINTEIERYLKVTREDLKRVANQYLDENRRVVLLYMPKSAENN